MKLILFSFFGIFALMASAMPSQLVERNIEGQYPDTHPFINATDPFINATAPKHTPSSQVIDCNNRPGDVSQAHCQQASNIGISGLASGNANIRYGSNGPYVFYFGNHASESIMVIVWQQPNQFISGQLPAITHTLNSGDAVMVSADSNISGGFGAMHSDTSLNYAGQLWNTVGEFSTFGQYATFDVSREVNMQGHNVQMEGNGLGCSAQWYNGFSQCCYTCSSYDRADYHSCGSDGSYWIDNCYSGDPGAAAGGDLKSGGCQGGWNWVNVQFS